VTDCWDRGGVTSSWLEIEHVTVKFGSRHALRDVTLSLGAGVTALLGRNGAGKTTLCRVIAGDLPPPDTGLVHRGRAVSADRAVPAGLSALGWLPQCSSSMSRARGSTPCSASSFMV